MMIASAEGKQRLKRESQNKRLTISCKETMCGRQRKRQSKKRVTNWRPQNQVNKFYYMVIIIKDKTEMLQ